MDFVIPNAKDPKAIMEVMRTTLLRGKKKNYRLFICLLDHKFQMIKARYSLLTTAMVLIPRGIPTDMQRMKEMIQVETLNTDLYAIKEEEIESLINKIELIIAES